MRVSDYVFHYLRGLGVGHVFLLTGGGMMYLSDSLGRSGIRYVCCHHEQAAAIAAQAYGMYQDTLGVCLVTTGPGGTNALTGTAAAFMDSTPVLFLSGQVKRSDFASLRSVRQYGAQENDIVAMARPVTKYAATVMNPEDIALELERAVHGATHGRKGPVWLDIPLDVQAAEIDADALAHYSPPPEERPGNLRESAEQCVQLLRESRRPLLLLGHGVAASRSQEDVRRFIAQTGIPVMATWRMLDFMGTEEEDFFGSPGLQAPRYSNLILQHCDFLLVLGSRLDNMITAFHEPHFAFRAKKVLVDADARELEKLRVTDAVPIHAAAGAFMPVLLEALGQAPAFPDWSGWKDRCKTVRSRYPVLNERQPSPKGVSLYRVTDEISRQAAAEDTIVISSTSRCNTAGHIAFRRKRGQKSVSSMGMGSMGFALPSAIGAYYAAAAGNRRVVVIEGDGSLQLNIQELQTIVHNGIPAKLFIFENGGYAAIAAMQERNFDGFYVGCNPRSGLSMPNHERIASAYGIPCRRIDREEDISGVVGWAMETDGPCMALIGGSMAFDEIPKCISSVDKTTGQRVSAALENPWPFLPEEEMAEITRLLLD